MNTADCSEYLAKIIDHLNKGLSITSLIKDNSAITNYKKEKDLFKEHKN